MSMMQEDDEDVVLESGAGPIVVSIGNPRSRRLVPLAFTVPDDLPPVIEAGLALSWTEEAAAAFRGLMAELSGAAGEHRNLPSDGLRVLLEFTITDLASMDLGAGLGSYALGGREPFAYVYGTDGERAKLAVARTTREWISMFLEPHVSRAGLSSSKRLDRVREVCEGESAIAVRPYSDRVLPWPWSTHTGTTKAPGRTAYRALADHVARRLAGCELFDGVGPMCRHIARYDQSSGMSELVSRPIRLDDSDAFSLRVVFEVVTFPGVHQPVLTLNVTKRRWLSSLADKASDRNDIGGTAFAANHPDRAFGFQLQHRRIGDGATDWVVDAAYMALQNRLGLPLQVRTAGPIARGHASVAGHEVLLKFREGLQEKGHSIKAGVPERDKLETFDRVAELVAPLGLVPFGAGRVRAVHRQDDSGSRMIRPITILNAGIERLAEDDATEVIGRQPSQEVEALLRSHLEAAISALPEWRRKEETTPQTVELETLVAANAAALQRLYPGEKPLLIVFHEDGHDEDVQLLTSSVRVLLRDSVDLITNRIPANTHGPRRALPGAEKSNRDRASMRGEAWRTTATQVAEFGRRVFCLVMAREWYPTGERFGRDDRVNKAATRRALAAVGGACVQFLLPPNRRGDSVQVGDFVHRTQAALKDLISAHSGRIDGVPESVARWFHNVPDAERPRELVGITIVRKNAGRTRRLERTFLPVAIRLDLVTGHLDMRCAYEAPQGLVVTPWQRFPDALATVSRLSPVKLADKREIRKTQFMDFVEGVISESVEREAKPVILIDSSNCVQLWPWLSDQNLGVTGIQIGEREWMEQEWSGARLIRVRQELAPGLIEDKVRLLAHSSRDDERSRDELQAELEISVPASAVGLFRIGADDVPEDACATFLSVAKKTLHQYRRGASCYKQVSLPATLHKQKNAAREQLRVIQDVPPWKKQWPSPNALEIVVALRQPSDDPSRLAAFAESLRYGFGHYSEGTSLPAPLFFERVVRDYISEFAITDEQAEDEE